MTAQCCICKKLEIRGKWRARKREPREPITYSYCPRCFDEARLSILSERATADAIRTTV